MVKINKIILILLSFFIIIQSSFALQTYIGVKILNLTDISTNSCAFQNGTNALGNHYDYGPQGMIRGFSSIVGSNETYQYPIFFNLTYLSNGTEVWSGNSTDDTDYGIGDIIQIPELVDLTLGEDYNFSFDVDVYKIYIDLESVNGFEAKLDDIYWTAGERGISGGYYEYYEKGGCGYSSSSYTIQSNLFPIYNQRNSSFELPSCYKDYKTYSCNTTHMIAVGYLEYEGIFPLYQGLLNPNVGRFDIPFTFQ